MSNRLANKVCIITGTSGSIGRAAALAFAREGAIIVGSGQHIGDSEEAIKAVRAAGGTMAVFEPCDLGSSKDCQALVDFAVKSYGCSTTPQGPTSTGLKTSPMKSGTVTGATKLILSSTLRARPGRI